MKRTFLFILLFAIAGSAFAQTESSVELQVSPRLSQLTTPNPASLNATVQSGEASKSDALPIRIYYWGSEDTVRQLFSAPNYFPIIGASFAPHYQPFGTQINSRMTQSTPNATSTRTSRQSYVFGQMLFGSAGVVFNEFRDVANNNVSSIPNTYRIDSIRINGFQIKTTDQLVTEDTFRLTITRVDSINQNIPGGRRTFSYPSTNKPVEKPILFTTSINSAVNLFPQLLSFLTFPVGTTVTGNSPLPFAAVIDFFAPEEDTFYLSSSFRPAPDPNPTPGSFRSRALSYPKGVWRRPFASNASSASNRWSVSDFVGAASDTVNTQFSLFAAPFVEAFVDLDPNATSIEKDVLGSDLTALAAYPNPVLRGDEVRLPFRTNVKSNVQLTVTNLLGATVYSQNIQNLVAGEHAVEVNTASFAPGVYVARMEASFGAAATSRFIVK